MLSPSRWQADRHTGRPTRLDNPRGLRRRRRGRKPTGRRMTSLNPSVALNGCQIQRALNATVEIVEASPQNRRFPDRISETLGVCLKSGAGHDVVVDGRPRRYPADSICVRAPGCVWSTESTGPVAFLSLDIEAIWLPPGGVAGSMQFLPANCVPDLRSLVRTLRSEAAPLEQQTAVAELVAALITQGALRSPGFCADDGRNATERARELLLSRLPAPPTLEELANAVSANRFVLLRGFRRSFGLTPHAFTLRARIERSRGLLARGNDVAEVAHDLGFADQSHFSRLFKRVYGVTPGRYRRQAHRIAAVP